ncbi:MAG: uracil-DNA glycosylase [Bacteroidia bacterium]
MSNIDPKLDESWKKVLAEEFKRPSFVSLKAFLLNEKKSGQQIFPPGPEIFAALDATPFENVKVVLLGQDPYHGAGQAHGLSFSVKAGQKLPPSLQNIYKELRSDLNIPMNSSGDLTAWAKQGVLLLNATLTVRENQPGSHQKKGWEEFTDAIIRELSARRNGLIFLLWGRYAQAKENLIDTTKHFILRAAHPSPFSADRGFFGCRHFSKVNELLAEQGLSPINWDLTAGAYNEADKHSLATR